MHLVQIGYLTLSLKHLITAEDAEGPGAPPELPKGVLRVTVKEGRVIDLTGDLAEEGRRLLAEARTATAKKTRPALVGRTVHPKPRADVRRDEAE